MRKLITFISLFYIAFTFGQSRDDFFIESANLFLNNKNSEALEVVNEGLYNFPNDKKLTALKKKLEQQQKKNNQNQENKSDSQENNQNKEKENQEQNQNPSNNKEGERQKFNRDLQKEMYGNTLKALQKQEMRIKRRMIRAMGKTQSVDKEKDW